MSISDFYMRFSFYAGKISKIILDAYFKVSCTVFTLNLLMEDRLCCRKIEHKLGILALNCNQPVTFLVYFFNQSISKISPFLSRSSSMKR